MKTLTTTLNKVKNVIPLLLKANIVPFMFSSPGIGKSSVAQQIADDYNLLLIDIRMSMLDPSDIQGLPHFENGKAKFQPFDTFPLENTPIPDGYKGWLILLDEFNSAPHSVMAAAYQLVLDRKVGAHKLHPKVAMIAAGNLEDDNAIVNTMSTALISRFSHFYINIDHNEWMEWASKERIDIRIISFLGFKKDYLYTFKADATSPYSCPRTWSMLSKVIKNISELDRSNLVLVASLIGEGVAREFLNFLKLYKSIPTFASIVKDPDTAPVDSNLGTQWAVMGMVCQSMDENTISPACTYLQRLSMELQVCAFREIQAANPELMTKPEIRKWKLALSKDIFYN